MVKKPQNPDTTSYLLLIDGHALIYRAYHAFPALTTKEGLLVNAVYGFTRHILTAIREYQPTYLAVAFDHPKPTFRHTSYAEYKAHRVAMPDDLIPQIEIIKNVVTTLNIPQFELEGYEADDLIGTLTKQAEAVAEQAQPELMSIIVTGDRDAFQLVSDRTHAWLPGRGKNQVDQEFDPIAVTAKMGVSPEQIVDLKALMGDASDNIPGVKGIGEKTAQSLITTFSSLELLYQAADQQSPEFLALSPKLQTKIIEGKAEAFLSQQLARIDRLVPIELNLAQCQVTQYDKSAAATLFQDLDFRSLVALLPADDFELGVQSALF